MQSSMVMNGVREALAAMTPEAAQHYLEIGQAYAEIYPKPACIELVKPIENSHLTMLKTVGELSPIGLCLMNWSTRTIEWRNGAYDRTFLGVIDKQVNEGVKIGETVPEFTRLGLDKLFDQVASTGEPYTAECFPLPMPSGTTYWSCSLSLLTTVVESTYLFLQLQRVQAPAQALAA